MAARGIKTYEPMDKMPSATLKRHPKMDLNKNDLLRLLSYLEGELQARDITIAALKAEKAKQLLYQAKYGRFGLGDPFHAMQRDSDHHRDNSFDEAAVKAMYDNQLIQLENLIATQRKAQQRMREQLAAVEKRYHKVCAELEEEKQKHAMDTAQGDDVTYMLEKDRERLKQELEFERSQTKRQDKENKKLAASLEETAAFSDKHKQVALMLIKERKHYMEKLVVLQHKNTVLESALRDDSSKMATVAEGLAQESHKSLQMEAALEKQLSEFDTEREQLKRRLLREESRNKDLTGQIQNLQQQLEELTMQQGSTRGARVSRNTAGGVSGDVSESPPPEGTRRLPIVHVQNSPAAADRDSVAPSVSYHPQVKTTLSGGFHSGIRVVSDSSTGSLSDSSISAAGSSITHDKPPLPADKPSVDLSAGTPRGVSVINAGLGGVSSVITPQPIATPPQPSAGNTTVFTTPSGTRISLNVGPSVAVSSPGGASRRAVGGSAGRGVPPPLPPNKPQVFIPSPAPGSGSARSRDAMVRGITTHNTRTVTVGGSTSKHPTTTTNAMNSGQSNPLQKLGINMSQDKITVSNPHH